MTFKEAMNEMIDGRECIRGNLTYRFFRSKLEYYSHADKWVLSLDGYHTKDWELAKKSIIINGKTIELSEESYQELKKSLK